MASLCSHPAWFCLVSGKLWQLRNTLNNRSPATVRKTRFLCLVVLVLISILLSGCSQTQNTTTTGRSTWEQLLLSQSLQRSLSSATIPLNPGETVAVEAVGLTGDKEFAQSMVVSWLRRQGLYVRDEGSTYLVRIILHAFGTEQSQSFFGVPAIQSTIIPFALPELSLFKAVRQRGYSRLNLEVSDKKSGILIALSPVYEGDVYFNQITFLLALGYNSTDIVPPPL